MNTIENIRRDMSKILPSSPTSRKVWSNLNLCLRYLETNPSEEFITDQLTETTRVISIIDNRYVDFLESIKYDCSKKFKSEIAKRRYYNKINDRPRLVRQSETLKYLLKSK